MKLAITILYPMSVNDAARRVDTDDPGELEEALRRALDQSTTGEITIKREDDPRFAEAGPKP